MITEKYTPDDKSNDLGELEDVYYLTRWNYLYEAYIYARCNVVFEHMRENDEELYDILNEKYSIEDMHYDEYLSSLDTISDQDHKAIIEYTKENKHDLESYLDDEFTSSALSYNETLDYPTLYHFSKYADSIVSEGFTKGVDEPSSLALTVFTHESAKEYGGFNFAFYSGSKVYDPTRYGSDFVMFTTKKALLCDHHGDREEQVIFWGSKAENITTFTTETPEDIRYNFYNVYSVQEYKSKYLKEIPSVKKQAKELEKYIKLHFDFDQILKNANEQEDTNFKDMPSFADFYDIREDYTKEEKIEGGKDAFKKYITFINVVADMAADYVDENGYSLLYAIRYIDGKQVMKFISRVDEYLEADDQEAIFKFVNESYNINNINKFFDQ